MHKPPLAVRIIVALIVLSTIGYYTFRSLAPKENVQLRASGTIEAVMVNISPEMAGKVVDVLAAEGQPVQTGDPLLSLDASLLTAQRAVASAQVDSANASLNTATAAYAVAQQQYDLTLNNALAQEQSTRTNVWRGTNPTEFDQPSWYFSKTERLTAAQSEVDATLAKLQEAQTKLADLQKSNGNAQFFTIEADLAQARLAWETAKGA